VGRLLMIGLLALLLAAAPGSAGAQRKGDPAELRKEFPLEPTPTPTAANAAAAPERARPPARDDGPITVSTVSVMILAAGLGAMAVTLARGSARGRAGAAAEPPHFEPPVVEPPPVRPPASAPPASGPPAVTPSTPKPPATKPPAAKPPAAKPPAAKPPAAKPPAAKPPAAPAPAGPTEPAPAPPAQPGWQSCRIRLWHGYIKKQFYAESPETGELVARSAFFRVEKGSTIEDSSNAADAFDALVDELVAAGWEITGRRPGSWDVALRRRAGAPRQPVQ
jgi:hypothetical protein